VEKLVYALWRPADAQLAAWCASLHASVPAELSRAGARGVQVNVSDDEVASALVRMSTFERPIEAVVSVWVDTAAGPEASAVSAALAAVSARSAGYLVTESVPLVPPDVEAGERTAGFANVALLRRPAELDRAEWLARWQGDHTRVAIDTQSTFGYVQNVVVRAVTPDAPAIDGIVEELFPAAALTDFHVFFDTGGSDAELGRRMTAMTDSVARFSGPDAVLDVVPTSRYVLASPFGG
jgi:hypothetical protein